MNRYFILNNVQVLYIILNNNVHFFKTNCWHQTSKW